MRRLPALAFLPTLLAALPAQGPTWSQLLDARWPGTAIQKRSERDFFAFAKQHPGLDTKSGWQLFCQRQAQAYGLTAPAFLANAAVTQGPRPEVSRTIEAVRAESEPNNSQASGNPLPCGDHLEGSLTAGDTDWFTFSLAQPSHLTAVISPGPDGIETDTVLFVYNAAGNLLAFNDDASRSWMSVVDLDLPAGGYAVLVRHFDAANGTGNYALDLQCGAFGNGFVMTPEGAEPNNAPPSGTPTPLGCGLQGNGVLTTGDSDWWTITLTSRVMVRAETGMGLTGASSNDTILYLRDSTGAQLAYDDDSAPGNWSLACMVLNPGTYYADVQGYGGGNAGSYTLQITCLDASVTIAEFPEPNHSPLNGGVPGVTGCAQTVEGEVFPGGDRDWFGLYVAQDTFVTFETWPAGVTANANPIVDSILFLYDSNLQQIATDDDSGPNFLSRMQVFLPAGSYYLEMAGFATGTGTYLVTMQCDQLAAYQNFLGGCLGNGTTVTSWQVRPYEYPLAGTTFVGEFVGAPANGLVLGFLGFSRSLAGGSVPLPFDLGAIGAPGCRIEIDPLSTFVLLANSGGGATWPIALPYNPALVGVKFGQQGLVLDAAANAAGIRTTNAGYGVISTRL